MKNLLSFIVLFFCASHVHAQTEKSTLMVGGEMLLLSQADNTVFTATPNIGVLLQVLKLPLLLVTVTLHGG